MEELIFFLVGLACPTLLESSGNEAIAFAQEVLKDDQVLDEAGVLLVDVLVVILVEGLSCKLYILLNIRKSLDVVAVAILPAADKVALAGYASGTSLECLVCFKSEAINV